MYLHGAIFGVAGYISVSMGTILFQSLRSRTRDSKDIVFKQFLASCKCSSIFFVIASQTEKPREKAPQTEKPHAFLGSNRKPMVGVKTEKP